MMEKAKTVIRWVITVGSVIVTAGEACLTIASKLGAASKNS